MEIKANPYHGNFFPPYSEKLVSLSPTSGGTRFKKIMMMLSVGLVAGLIVGAICSGISHGATWAAYTGAGIAILIFGASLPSILKSRQAPCPYCNKMIGDGASTSITDTDENVQTECPQCFEWLISHQGQIRAYKSSDAGDKKEFKCPAFVNAFWKPECIVCGAPPTHYSGAKQTKVQVAKLLVGKLSVTSAAINTIPYCNEHNDAVGVDVFVDELHLIFNDYDARRRYLNANQYRQVMKTK